MADTSGAVNIDMPMYSKNRKLPPNPFANLGSFADQVTNLTPSLITVYNIQTGQFVYLNKSLKPLLGYDNEEWLEKGVGFVMTKVHPDDQQRMVAENQAALDSDAKLKNPNHNPIVEFEYRVRHANGSYVWLKTYGAVFDRDEFGQVKHVINISLDITATKTTEEKLLQLTDQLEQKVEERTKELQESKEKYRTLFATLAEGVILQDTTGKLLAANPSAQKILGLNFDEMQKRSTIKEHRSQYIYGDGSNLPDDKFPFVRALKTGEPQKNIRMGIVRDNRTYWLLVNSIPLKKEDGKPYAVASSFQDITAQKQFEKQKDEFISIASHELKTPITTIKSFSEILKMKFPKQEKAQYYLGKMNKEIDRLTELVNELLDVSKIQSGNLTLKKDYEDSAEFVQEVIEDIQPSTPTHIIIAENILSVKVKMDKHRMYQVLMNLVSNAIKYSPHADKVLVSTKKKNNRIIFSVSDFGIGITPRDQKKIFDPFFQASTTIRQSQSGLGLGLHIAKEIINRHGGEIWVESKKKVGSTFSFSLPLENKQV